MLNRTFFTTVILSIFFIPLTCNAGTNVMFILDGSNSMWGQVGGVAKIKTAKNVLAKMLGELPADTKVGLMAYGYTAKEDCKDVHVLAPIGSMDATGLTGKLDSIVPKGKTPITYALETSAHQFSDLEQNNQIVLISDGKETCGGDPCMVAAKLSKKGLHVKVHVVGFDVSGKEREQLECIAKAGGGRYFNASSTKDFKVAIAEVKKEVAVVKPKAKYKEYFFDNFEGENLKGAWEVLHPNPDNFIVEDGHLLVINSKAGNLLADNVENILRLTQPLPKGNWRATMKLNADYSTGQERIFFGLYDNKNNYLNSLISEKIGSCYPGGSYRYHLNLVANKVLRGKLTEASKEAWSITRDCQGPSGADYGTQMKKAQPILLRLEKKGRAYISSIKLEGVKKPVWFALDKLTVLRAKGGLAFGLFQANRTEGETSIYVDWVKVEVAEK